MKIFPKEPTRHMLDNGTRAFIESNFNLAKFLEAARNSVKDVEIVGWQDPLTKELKKDHPFICDMKAAEAGWKCLLAADFEEDIENPYEEN